MSLVISPLRGGLSLACGAMLALWSPASAALEIVLHNADEPDIGLNDPTPVDPAGTNDARTRGEQRWAAIERAADVWREALHGTIPVIVHVTMADLPCGALGASRSADYVTNVAGTEDDRIYSLPLAENLGKKPVNADDAADVFLELNGAECPDDGPTWYLGFDADAPPGSHALVNVAAHELAHGLGLESLVNPADGRALRDAGGLDPFSRLLFDTVAQHYWHELSAEQRRSSARTPRSLVWGGERVQLAALERLALGAPTLEATPPISGFSGMVTLPALSPSFERVEARVRSVLPADGCDAHTPTTVEHVLLVAEGSCSPSRMAALAAEAGALAVLEVESADRLPPPGFGRRETYADADLVIPVARIGALDGALLDAESAASVALFMDANRLAGADEQGRPFMYTPTQSNLGVSLSHWDPSLSPSCLLEPVPAADLRVLDVELEKAALFDLGWTDPEHAGSSGNGREFTVRGGCSTSALSRQALSIAWLSYACLALLVLRRIEVIAPPSR